MHLRWTQAHKRCDLDLRDRHGQFISAVYGHGKNWYLTAWIGLPILRESNSFRGLFASLDPRTMTAQLPTLAAMVDAGLIVERLRTAGRLERVFIDGEWVLPLSLIHI